VVITGSHFAACMQVITIIMLCTAAQAMHQSVMLGMALPALGAQYVSHSRVYVWLCATCVSVSAIEFDWQVVNTVVGGFRCHRASVMVTITGCCISEALIANEAVHGDRTTAVPYPNELNESL
jgi:hypothetical protein